MEQAVLWTVIDCVRFCVGSYTTSGVVGELADQGFLIHPSRFFAKGVRTVLF